MAKAVFRVMKKKIFNRKLRLNSREKIVKSYEFEFQVTVHRDKFL